MQPTKAVANCSHKMSTLCSSRNTSTSRPHEIKAIEREDFSEHGEVRIDADVIHEGKESTISGTGNGPISAFVDALEQQGLKDFKLMDYRQHSIGVGSKTEAAAIQVQHKDGSVYFGCGIDPNIELAGLRSGQCVQPGMVSDSTRIMLETPQLWSL